MATLYPEGVGRPIPQRPPPQQQQQPPQQQQQQHTITYQTVQAQPQPVGATVSNYNASAARYTGFLQMTCGLLSVVIGIVAITLDCTLASVASPIWSGVGFFIVAGILGVVSASNKNSCVIIGHLVMSIFASLAAFQMMCMMIVAALFEVECQYTYSIWGYSHHVCDHLYGKIAVDSIGGVIALVEFIVAIVAAALCCRGSCGSGTVATQQTVVHHYVPNQGNVTIMTTPQPYSQTVAPQHGYVQQTQGYPMGQTQAFNNQGFTMPQPGAQPMAAPPPYNFEDKAHGMPIAEA